MEQGFLRTSLNGSALTGLLSRLALIEGPTAKPFFVEGMGRWLGWTDAIPLAAALQEPTSVGGAKPPARPSRALSLAAHVEREFTRVHAALSRAIEDDGPPAADSRRRGQPVAASLEPVAADTDFPPYRRRYIALQQAMEAGIRPLRTQARTELARLSPEMSRLAAVDAVMCEVLGVREQALLSTMPSLLEKHFKRMCRTHRETTVALDRADAPDDASHGGAWLIEFRKDMQRMLLAELDLRMQPVQGLLETLQTRPPGFHE